jgi:hypothetical protein
VSLFGHAVLPLDTFLAAGCEEELLDRLQEQAWLRSSGPGELVLDPYLTDWLRKRWLDDDCPWLTCDDDLPSAFRKVIEATQSVQATAAAPAPTDLLERAHAWMRQAQSGLAPGRHQALFARMQRELTLQLLPQLCDDVVLPVDAEEVSQVATENLDEAGLETLISRFVAVSRVVSPDFSSVVRQLIWRDGPTRGSNWV